MTRVYILAKISIEKACVIWYNDYKQYVPRFYRAVERIICFMETRVAVIAIIAENSSSAEDINSLLHEYAGYIIGRMGVPYRTNGVNIISVAIDAPQDKINTLAGKIGRLSGVTAKTVYSPV